MGADCRHVGYPVSGGGEKKQACHPNKTTKNVRHILINKLLLYSFQIWLHILYYI